MSSSNYTPLPNFPPSETNSKPFVPRYKDEIEIKEMPHEITQFTETIGDIPFFQPNIHSSEDLFKYIEVRKPLSEDFFTSCVSTLCCLSGIFSCYVCAKTHLVNDGQYGFSLDSGKPTLLLSGRHVLLSPFNAFQFVKNMSDDVIVVGPITIVRVHQGQIGFAMNGSEPELLLPGLHARCDGAYKFHRCEPVDKALISFGPIKLLTVQSGGVRVCYANGSVKIFQQGRYGINSGTFIVAGHITTQQQNLRFEKHPVLLDGGINMLVEGLLTYQVIDVVKLIHQLGEKDLVRAITDVTKAELARVFASLHLEQISRASMPKSGEEKLNIVDEPSGMLGKGAALDSNGPNSAEGETRMWICKQVIDSLVPITEAWGVHIVNFQLESTSLRDPKYSELYESASLEISKAKADLRAIEAQNLIKIKNAETQANALKIEAEGRKTAVIIDAQAQAEARRIDSQARNEAGEVMKNEFAKQFALSNQNVEFAKNLNVDVLTVVPESAVGQAIINNSLLAKRK